jgi:hypothetical protein
VKHVTAFAVLLTGLVVAPAISRAQDHAEVGVFADYFRLGETTSNFVGVGGRAGVHVGRPVELEAEMSYDFNHAFTEGFQDTSGAVTFTNSNIRVLHGLFGPKLETKGRVKIFVTAKGGFVNFRLDPRPPSFDTFTSSVDNLRTNNVSAVFYPGGGFEAFLGPFGVRLEAGDEMYLANGAHHNLRVTFGPQLRF